MFSLAMWYLMSRSISIGGLVFHNVKSGVSDSIKFKFDETKADKTGEFFKKIIAMLIRLILVYVSSLRLDVG